MNAIASIYSGTAFQTYNGGTPNSGLTFVIHRSTVCQLRLGVSVHFHDLNTHVLFHDRYEHMNFFQRGGKGGWGGGGGGGGEKKNLNGSVS